MTSFVGLKHLELWKCNDNAAASILTTHEMLPAAVPGAVGSAGKRRGAAHDSIARSRR